MKIVINKKQLLESIKVCNSIIESSNSSPIFLGLFIEVLDDHVRFTSTNGTISVNSVVYKNDECSILKQGAVLIKSKSFFSIIQKMKNENITLEKVDNSVLKIKTSTFDLNTNIMDDSQYPSINFSYSNWKEIDIPAIVFKKILSKIKQSVNNNKERPSIFSGVCFISNSEKETLEVIGTDTFKLSYYCFNYKSDNFKFVLDMDLIQLFLELIEFNNSVKIYLSDNNVIIKINNIVISSKILEGEYPNINGIINSPKLNKYVISKKELIEALERGIVVSSSEKKPIAKTNFDKSIMKLSFRSSDLGNSEEEITCTSSSTQQDHITISFNASFMIALLKVFENDVINIYTSYENKPIVLEDEYEENFVQLLVPIKSY